MSTVTVSKTLTTTSMLSPVTDPTPYVIEATLAMVTSLTQHSSKRALYAPVAYTGRPDRLALTLIALTAVCRQLLVSNSQLTLSNALTPLLKDFATSRSSVT